MSAKRHKATSPRRSWVPYGRSYLVTFGLTCIALMAIIWTKEGDELADWPTWSYFVFFGFPVLGLILIADGVLAGRDQIEKWADAASRHEASIIIMIVAFPVFLVMSMFKRRE